MNEKVLEEVIERGKKIELLIKKYKELEKLMFELIDELEQLKGNNQVSSLKITRQKRIF